jgi:hypothetical protein
MHLEPMPLSQHGSGWAVEHWRGRHGARLARWRNRGCRKSEEEEIAEQLNGHWREDYLFSLRQSLQLCDAIAQRIADYDREIWPALPRSSPASVCYSSS